MRGSRGMSGAQQNCSRHNVQCRAVAVHRRCSPRCYGWRRERPVKKGWFAVVVLHGPVRTVKPDHHVRVVGAMGNGDMGSQ